MEFKIGIVEPDVDILRILTQVLQDTHCTLLTYPSAEEALAKRDQEGLHLFISEWGLSGMSGADFCRTVQNDSPGFPFIFISDAKEIEIRLQALQLGALDFVIKPFDRQYLLAKVKAVLALLHRTLALPDYDKSQKSKRLPDFIFYLRQQKLSGVTPVPDLNAKFGFSYPQVSDWAKKVFSADEQNQILNDLSAQGWFEKRVYDIVKICPACNSFNLTVRPICPTCHAPVLPQALRRDHPERENLPDSTHRDHCPQCYSELTKTLSYARCLACGKDFDDKESRIEIIYAYQIKTLPAEATVAKTNDWLSKFLLDEGVQFFSGDLYQDFLRLELHQHELMHQSFAVMKIRFLQIEQAQRQEKFLKKLSHVLLILQKLVGANAILFALPPDTLAVFLSYTDLAAARLKESRLQSYLERLGLSSWVDIKSSSHNLSSILDQLEHDYLLEEHLP